MLLISPFATSSSSVSSSLRGRGGVAKVVATAAMAWTSLFLLLTILPKDVVSSQRRPRQLQPSPSKAPPTPWKQLSQEQRLDIFRASRTLVNALDIDRFKRHIQQLSGAEGPTKGSRYWNQPGNDAALEYIYDELISYGYTSEQIRKHEYVYQGVRKYQLYATLTGAAYPDRMYIVSAHVDSINFDDRSNNFRYAPGANDDASGTALVLEVARVLKQLMSENKVSANEITIRFIFWNNEETGLNGSRAYVQDRRTLQGQETPPNSGQYPEPLWLGILQHDQLLWDHGTPSTLDSKQNPLTADLDLEYAASSSKATASLEFANTVHRANRKVQRHVTWRQKRLEGKQQQQQQQQQQQLPSSTASSTMIRTYPTEVSNDMCCTDSVPFQDICASVSMRDNRRRSEMGQGSHPTWHTNYDTFEQYSQLDYALGFNAVRTTTWAVTELSRTTKTKRKRTGTAAVRSSASVATKERDEEEKP